MDNLLRNTKGRFRLAQKALHLQVQNTQNAIKKDLSPQADWAINFIQPIKLQERSSFFWARRFLRESKTALKVVYLLHSSQLSVVCASIVTLKSFYHYLIRLMSAKSLKSNTGGGSFCWIGIENAVPYTQKYTPPHCFLCNFSGLILSLFRIMHSKICK